MTNRIPVMRPDPANVSRGCLPTDRPMDRAATVAGRWLSAASLSGLGFIVPGVLVFMVAIAAQAQNPTLPVIPATNFNVLSYGAVGNGSTDNSTAINDTIIAANAAGGGTVEIPADGTLSTYLSGPITMLSSVNLQIDAGAMLQMLPYGSWPSSSTYFITSSSLNNIEISGSGTIDGNGAAWWAAFYSNNISRPYMVYFTSCSEVLIQNVTLQNPPEMHIVFKGNDDDITIQGITINTTNTVPFPAKNTDGIDLIGENCLVQNCTINAGDDNIAMGSSSGTSSDIVITNCNFGFGHGVSIGSGTRGGVSNLKVSGCYWYGTEYGIHGKSDTDRGGMVENLTYENLTMTNVNFPIAFYSTYVQVGTPQNTFTYTPGYASTYTDTGTYTPYWQNITVSNLNAIGVGGNVAGFLWGLPQAPIANLTLYNVNIAAPTNTFCMYNVQGVQIINSNLTAPNTSTNTLTLYNAQFIITNNAPNPNTVTMTGVWAPSNTVMSLFNGLAETADTGALGANPLLTLAGSTLTVSNNASFGGSSVLNYGLGTNTTETVVTGNLTLGGTLNVANFGGFTNASYSLFTYGGSLAYNGLSVGTTPNSSFTYTVSTNTPGQVNLVVCAIGAAGSINGPTSVPPATNGVVYSISNVSGATTYTWTVPPGASIASGQGTTSITANYPCAAASGNVTVTPSAGSCTGEASSLGVTVSAGRTAFTLMTLYEFSGSTNGQYPYASLVQGSDGNFYGTTYQGGTNGDGTVFKITSQGTLTTLWQFNGTNGANPYAGLVQGSDSNFYGTASGGGTNNHGTVFKITSQGTLTTLWQFNGTNGATPYAGLVQGSDSNFYGTTYAGGTNGEGTVFKITSQGTLTTLWQFGANPTNGDNPHADLVQGGDGNFYGTTYQGGTNGDGTVFKITPQGTLTTLWQFGGSNGQYPYASLVQGSDSNFYGTTYAGGTNFGTVFKITSEGTLTTLWDFGPGFAGGTLPYAGLVQGSDGNFYGTTYGGGTNNDGSVFKITPQGTLTTVWQFNGSNGKNPNAGLVQGSDGNFYGTTYQGGTNYVVISGSTNYLGTVFKLVASSPPEASFTATPTSGAAPLGVSFTDTSCGSVTGWAWAFGDGNTSASGNPSDIYAGPGNYTVQEIVSGLGGTSTSTVANLISVYSPFAWWHLNYFGTTNNSGKTAPTADYTGTGMSNTNKFMAGFNPLNPAAYLHIISIVAGQTNVVVTYLGASGDNTYIPGIASRTNVLEFTPASATGSYSNNFTSTGQTNILSSGNGLGTETNMTDFGGATNSPSRYYRVRVLLP